MKIINSNQFSNFELTNLVHITYEQNHWYNTKIIVVKPFDLAKEYLKKQPIRILFVRNKTNEILVELKIKSQTQIAQCLKFLHELGISKNAIASILVPVLTGWNEDLKENEAEIVLYPNANKLYQTTLDKINKK